MCGIAGFTHSKERPDPSRIRAITHAIHHRGPDRQDVWESAQVSLGAVRLKIIDLEHGDQPMVSDNGDVILVYNGEVYNHAEIRQELERHGHRFSSRCDTEVVLKAFQQWDTQAFTRFRGMYAAAFWIQSQGRLVLLRDRLGIKPLYYLEKDGELYFGSEMKNILLHPEVPRRLNPFALDRYLGLNYIPGGETVGYPTMVEGIHKLPPGHWMEWRDGAIANDGYWSLNFKPDARMDYQSAKDELDRLLKLATEEHLVSDAPLGIWSSGGLDSSTIVHYATQATSAKLKSFSVSFRGRSFDETAYFRQIAEHYGTEHHEFDLNPDVDLRSAIESFATYSDEPSADAGALPVWFLSKMCRSDVTVALSGDGADELFGGYKTYLADGYARTLRHVPSSLRALAAQASRLLPASDEKIGLDYMIRRMLEGSLLDPASAHFYWNGTFGEQERRKLLLDASWRSPAIPLPGGNVGYLNQFLWLDQLCYLPDDILNKVDRMSMAHSLEVRPPFLDHRIVEFAATLPEDFKIRNGNLKFILRDLMKDRLPKAVVQRGKEGFDIPTHHWLRTTLKPLLLETLNEKDVRASGVLHWETVEGFIRAHLERRGNFGYHLWGLLILFLWIKRWGIEPPSQQPAMQAAATRRMPTATVSTP